MNNDDLYDDIKDQDDDDNGFDDDFDSDLDDEHHKRKIIKKVNISRKKILLGIVAASFVIILITCVIAFIIIKNDTPPSVVMVHIESNNEKDKTIAKYGNMITLTFTFDKEIKNMPTVTIYDRKVESFGSGHEFYAKYFVQAQDYEDVVVTFSIKDYKDTFGKTGKEVNTTTDLSKVVIPSY